MKLATVGLANHIGPQTEDTWLGSQLQSASHNAPSAPLPRVHIQSKTGRPPMRSISALIGLIALLEPPPPPLPGRWEPTDEEV